MNSIEKRALQIVVALACLVPVGAGGTGVLLGPRMLGPTLAVSSDLDSHYRYLSGLLLGIGIGYLSTIPHIERHGRRFALLTAIVVAGGIGRLMSLLSHGPPSGPMQAALVMELLITPGLALWQRRVAGKS
jgi:hypothetical protein